MKRPLLLDLYCGAGGAAKGYYDAGFDVIGVDLHKQPRFPYRFVQADALGYLDALLTFGCADDIVAIHASPPCQAFSSLSNCVPGTKEKYPDLIEPTRSRLIKTGLPYVIENVVGAPLKPTVTLCGMTFGRKMRLHRLFEANFHIDQPECHHTGYSLTTFGPRPRARIKELYPDMPEGRAWKILKGVEWMSNHESNEAIIPDYTTYIGKYLMQAIESREKIAA